MPVSIINYSFDCGDKDNCHDHAFIWLTKDWMHIFKVILLDLSNNFKNIFLGNSNMDSP